MQDLISELHNLTAELQQENHSIMQLIQRYATSTCLTFSPGDDPSPGPPRVQDIQVPLAKEKQFAETSFSRVSSHTVKQSSQRGKSNRSIRQSKVTQKMNSSARKPGPSKSRFSCGKMLSPGRESVLCRLKKVSQKTLSKTPSSVVLLKKSKIYHFKDHF